MKICIIGGGAAGLCAARHLTEMSNLPEFVVFERETEIGGTWVYMDRTTYDDGLPVHSSMYKNLRTNLPKDVMCFPDFLEFGGNGTAVGHADVLNYLRRYTDHFKLTRYIRLDTLVEKVVALDGGNWKWQVQIKDLKTGATNEEYFDVIIVCNGHYSTPNKPHISGLDSFTGQVTHSHEYRSAEKFTGKTIFMVGGNYSGIDIALELATTANTVYLSHHRPEKLSGMPKNLIQVSDVSHVQGNDIFLKDDDVQVVKADVFIYCTGYNYNFSFLDKSCGILLEGNHVKPLFKHIVNIKHPSMFFIGIPNQVTPLPLFHIQAQFIVAVLKRVFKLPSDEEMLIEQDFWVKRVNNFSRHIHKLGNAQWPYYKELSEMGKFNNLPNWYEIAYNHWSSVRNKYFSSYKMMNMTITHPTEENPRLKISITLPSNDDSISINEKDFQGTIEIESK